MKVFTNIAVAVVFISTGTGAPIDLDVDCSGDTGGCTERDANSECSVSDGHVCKCSNGFYDDNGAIAQGNCEAVVAFGGDCSGATMGNGACSTATAHSECSGGTCVCASGFYDTGANTCDAIVTLNGDCSGSTVGNTACSSSTPNSECSSGACSCVSGFYDTTSGAGGACEAVVALKGDCSASTNGNLACQGATANSECSGVACSCSDGYTANTTSMSGGKCGKRLGESCSSSTECTDITANSLCDTTCKCKSGFVDSNGGSTIGGTCEAENGAVRMHTGLFTLAGMLIVITVVTL